MDGQKFDRITKALAIGADRRALVKGLAGSAFGGALALASVGTRAARNCREIGQTCQSHAQCCTQFCPNTTFRCTCPVACPGANAQDCCAQGETCCNNQCCAASRLCCTHATTGAQTCVTGLCSGGQIFDAATCQCVSPPAGCVAVGGACQSTSQCCAGTCRNTPAGRLCQL